MDVEKVIINQYFSLTNQSSSNGMSIITQPLIRAQPGHPRVWDLHILALNN